MKEYSIVIAVAFLCLTCSNEHKVDFNYFKVFTTYSADTMTAYNKDMGIANYAYYEPKTDSFFYRDLTGIDPSQYESFTGHLKNKSYIDTIRNLINELRKYKDGIIPDSYLGDAIYCGPEFYVEFNDNKGQHCYLFTLNGNKVFDQFDNFFRRLPALPWKKKAVSNNMINANTEVVAAMTTLGIYQKRKVPYIGSPCGPGIKMDKIYGTWRSVSQRYKDPGYYWKMTFKTNGICEFERIRDGKSTASHQSNFAADSKVKAFIFKSHDGITKLNILKLSDSCFEFTRNKSSIVERLDRL